MFYYDKENSDTSKDTAIQIVNVLDLYHSVLYYPRKYSD